jgi:hypothetical protein
MDARTRAHTHTHTHLDTFAHTRKLSQTHEHTHTHTHLHMHTHNARTHMYGMQHRHMHTHICTRTHASAQAPILDNHTISQSLGLQEVFRDPVVASDGQTYGAHLSAAAARCAAQLQARSVFRNAAVLTARIALDPPPHLLFPPTTANSLNPQSAPPSPAG